MCGENAGEDVRQTGKSIAQRERERARRRSRTPGQESTERLYAWYSEREGLKLCRELPICMFARVPAAVSNAGAFVREELLRRRRAGSLLEIRDVLMKEMYLMRRLDRFDAASGEGSVSCQRQRSGPVPMERRLTCADGG